MSTEPSKYAENQFLSATVRSLSLMAECLDDAVPKVTAAAALNPAFSAVHVALTSVYGQWSTQETALANAEASFASRTVAFEDKIASLTRRPDADTASLIEQWDVRIRFEVAYQGPTYTYLLPRGRETLTSGSYEQQLDALGDFAVRLSEQAGKPELLALSLTVGTFCGVARSLRSLQNEARVGVGAARDTLEDLRIAAAAALYACVGQGMVVWSAEPEKVDTLFDVNILRQPPLATPAPPADTVWAPAERTLSTTVLPDSATRLEAWRLGPGGAPERLAVGETDTRSVTIPADITFDSDKTYQLWLCARNARGTSQPGPIQTWTPE